MNMQELLTYVEELTFKTSMFGYDKDEVDIQLDKICDEAEAILKAKDKEIEELKKGSAAASENAEAAGQPETTIEITKEPETDSEPESDAASAADRAEGSTDQVETLQAKLADALRRLNETEEALQAEKAKSAAAEHVIEQMQKGGAGTAAAEAAEQPSETEAYRRYMKNADLLCKQLSDLESRQNGILEAAREEAREEKLKAEQEAAEIVGEARKTAERIIQDAETGRKNAIEEAKKIHEESLLKSAQEQKHCEELAAQKETMVQSLKKLTEETALLMEKMQG